MKTFVKPLPGTSNVKGSGTGSPAGDMNKVSDALVEIRSSVPNVPSDVSAATESQMNALASRVNALISRINALKTAPISDAFTRTSLGSSYTLLSGVTPTFANNQISHGIDASFFVANQPVKTYQMYSQLTIYATSTTVAHPQAVINYDSNSYYHGLYSVTNSQWEIYKAVNGAQTLIGSLPAPRPTTSYTLKLSQYQGTILLSSNDAVKVSYVDNTFLRGKQAGIMLPVAPSGSPARVIDDFVYSDI